MEDEKHDDDRVPAAAENEHVFATNGTTGHPSNFSLIESSPSPEQIGLTWHDLVCADPHEVRARELEALSRHKRAARVRECGTGLNGLWGNRYCKQRICPGCSELLAWRNAQKIRLRIAKMTKPHYLLVSVRSAGLGAKNMQEAFTVLRSAVRRVRARCFGDAVPGGAGAIEPRLSDDEKFFLVHSHLAIDLVSDVDELATTDEWHKVTTFKGAVRGNIQWNGPIISIGGFSSYGSKAQDWSPLPGTVSLPLLNMIRSGVKGRRLLIMWPLKVPFSD